MSNAHATALRTVQAEMEESEAEQTKLRWYQTITTDAFALRVLGEELERLEKHIDDLRDHIRACPSCGRASADDLRNQLGEQTT